MKNENEYQLTIIRCFFPKKSMQFTIERPPMPRITLRSLSQDLLIFVFSFFCFFAVRLPCCDMAISASGTPIVIISDSSNASALGAFEANLRREGTYLDGGNHHSRPARQLIRSRVRDGIANEAGWRKVKPCRQVLALRTGP